MKKKKNKNDEILLNVLNQNDNNNINFNKLKTENTNEIDDKSKKKKKKKKKIKNNNLIIMDGIEDKNKKILEYQDYELNSLTYKRALKRDKRNFTQYYISLLKINHLVIFSFFPIKDYNSRIIKIFLFFFFFTVHLTVNALFFNDNTMHKIYVDEGNYNFIYQIPQIIYSSIISGIINALIKFLSLSQDNIIELKHLSKKISIEEKHKKLINVLKIKFLIFFLLTSVLLVFFCFYVGCFCGIYRNTQIHLIKDSVISFSMSFLYPFGKCLIPSVIRINALKYKMEYLYKFSLLVSNI